MPAKVVEAQRGPIATPSDIAASLRAPKIVVEKVTKRFYSGKTVEALREMDLRIGEGEFICLVGPSGCGKSSLLRMLAQLSHPSGGSIEIHARNKDAVPTATVFQGYNVFPWKTVEDNVRFGLDIRKVPRAEANARTKRWLNKMGLQEFAHHYPPALSGGMLQRVSIARALVVEPEILLMDEPFAALDAQHRRIMQDELLALWQEDRRTVVFVTHSIDEAILLGDRIVVMSARPGRIIAEFEVPFERPRSADVRVDPQFANLEQKIWGLLHDEVERAYSGSHS